MDEKEKIMDIRSSFKGLKGKNKRRYRSVDIAGIIIISFIFLGIVISPYLGKETPANLEKNLSGNKAISGKSYKIVNSENVNVENAINNTVGKIGVPFVSKGFEITIKSVSPANLYTNVWLSVSNIDNKEKPFKIGEDSMIIDDAGERYEKNMYTTGIEIDQTNLSAQSTREGSIFFNKFKEGRDPKKLILDINGEKVEFKFSRSMPE